MYFGFSSPGSLISHITCATYLSMLRSISCIFRRIFMTGRTMSYLWFSRLFWSKSSDDINLLSYNLKMRRSNAQLVSAQMICDQRLGRNTNKIMMSSVKFASPSKCSITITKFTSQPNPTRSKFRFIFWYWSILVYSIPEFFFSSLMKMTCCCRKLTTTHISIITPLILLEEL